MSNKYSNVKNEMKNPSGIENENGNEKMANQKDISSTFVIIGDKKSQVNQLKKEFPQCFSIADDSADEIEIYVIDIILNDATEVLLNLKLPKDFPEVPPFLSLDKDLNSEHVQDKQIITPYLIDWANHENSNLKDLINDAILLLNYPNSKNDFERIEKNNKNKNQKENNISVPNIPAIEGHQSPLNSNLKNGQNKSNESAGSVFSLNPPKIEDDINNLLLKLKFNPVILEELSQSDSDLETYYYNFESVKKFNLELENLRDKLLQKAQSNSIKYKKFMGNLESLKDKITVYESFKQKIEEMKKENLSSLQVN